MGTFSNMEVPTVAEAETSRIALEEVTSDVMNLEDLIKAQHERDTEELIAKLCLKCEDQEIRKNIQIYEYGKGMNTIIRRYNQVTNENLKKLLQFLYNDAISNEIPTLKKNIVHEIICRIQNLLPDTCGMCNDKFQLEFEEEPVMPCTKCYQGSHRECVIKLINSTNINVNIDNLGSEEAKKLYNPLNIPGVYYLCKACARETIPSIADPESRIPELESQATDTEDTRSSVDNSTTIVANNSSGRNPDIAAYSGQLAESPPTVDLTEPDPAEGSAQQAVGDADNRRRTAKNDTICRFYNKGSCKHGVAGDECSFSHPEVCRKFTKFGTRQPRGCNLGKKCKFHHPVMCIYSLRKGECQNNRCSFRHLLGTKRPPPEEPRNSQERTTSQTPQTRAEQTLSQTQEQADRGSSAQHTNDAPPNNQISPGDFLDVGRLWKAEIMQEMDGRLESIKALIMNLYQANQLAATIGQVPPVNNPPSNTVQLSGQLPMQTTSHTEQAQPTVYQQQVMQPHQPQHQAMQSQQTQQTHNPPVLQPQQQSIQQAYQLGSQQTQGQTTYQPQQGSEQSQYSRQATRQTLMVPQQSQQRQQNQHLQYRTYHQQQYHPISQNQPLLQKNNNYHILQNQAHHHPQQPQQTV